MHFLALNALKIRASFFVFLQCKSSQLAGGDTVIVDAPAVSFKCVEQSQLFLGEMLAKKADSPSFYDLGPKSTNKKRE